MHLRRIACFLLGVWFAGNVALGWMARENFEAANALLKSPPYEIQKATAGLDSTRSRMLLHYLVSMEASESFPTWERVEVVLLLAVGGVLIADRQSRLFAVVPVALLLLVAYQYFFLTPQIVSLGQAVILAGDHAVARQRDQFATMHQLYGIVAVVKMLVGFALAVWLMILKSKSRRRRVADPDTEPFFDRRYAR